MYYAKLNINSEIFNVYSKKIKITDILNNLFNNINDKVEYEKTQKYPAETSNGIEEKESSTEIFCFSDLTKKDDSGHKSIYGKVNRRYPLFTEDFNVITRTSKKVVHKKNSSSISFYFDFKTEIITFCARKYFGQTQFIEAFNELVNISINNEMLFEVLLIIDPFSIREQLEKAYKITKIKSVIVPPNVNSEKFERLYTHPVKELEKGNIHKKTTIFESKNINDRGINLDAEIVAEVIDSNEAFINYEEGYGKLEAEGKNKDGSKFAFNSDINSPYITIIDDYIKGDELEFILAGQNGISILMAKNVIDQLTK